jgi:hypothetical protein
MTLPLRLALPAVLLCAAAAGGQAPRPCPPAPDPLPPLSDNVPVPRFFKRDTITSVALVAKF